MVSDGEWRFSSCEWSDGDGVMGEMNQGSCFIDEDAEHQ